MNGVQLIRKYCWSNIYQQVFLVAVLVVAALQLFVYFAYYLEASGNYQEVVDRVTEVRREIVNIDAQNSKFNTFKEYKDDIDEKYRIFQEPISRTDLNKGISESIQNLGLTMLEEQYAPTRIQNGVAMIQVKLRYRGSYQSIKESLFNFSNIMMLSQIENLELALEKDEVIAIVELKIYSKIGTGNV